MWETLYFYSILFLYGLHLHGLYKIIPEHSKKYESSFFFLTYSLLFCLGHCMHKNVIPCVLAHLSFFNRNALHVSKDCHEAQGNKVQQTEL